MNCYTKLKDDEAISRFIHSSASDKHEGDEDTPPFDLETAIRVLRQASYFSHAGWLAERYHAHGEYLRIAIEDTTDFAGALRYVQQLARGKIGGKDGREEAEESMKRWGGVLLANEPERTTQVLVEICCGVEKQSSPTKPVDVKSSLTGYDVQDNDSVATSVATATAPATAQPEQLPSPRAFFVHFVDHPQSFVVFLEEVLRRRFGKTLASLTPPSSLVGNEAPLPEPADPTAPSALRDGATRDEQALWNTLLELYVTSAAADEDSTSASKALKLLRCRHHVPYDETQALLVCTTHGFEDGFVLLYELLGMYEDIVQCASGPVTCLSRGC